MNCQKERKRLDSTPTARNFELRRLAIDQAGEIAETAGNLLSDRALSHEQRLAALTLLEAAFGAIDALERQEASA